MEPNPRIRDALASHADDWALVGELHDVPPYRVYEVRLDGRRAVLKMDAHPRGHAAAEGNVQAYVAVETSLPAPPVLAVGPDYYVAVWDDDAPKQGAPLTESWARVAGAALATLHAETAGDCRAYGTADPTVDGLVGDGHDRWIDAARARLQHHRPYLAARGHADVVDAVENFLGDHPAAFEGAGDPVLCHGNVHPEHLAVEGSEVRSIIDFEHALVAPGEYDYWRSALPLFGPDTDERIERTFRESYESVRPLPDGFERRRDLYVLVNAPAYLEALYLQENVPAAEREDRAEWFRETAFERLAALRGRCEA